MARSQAARIAFVGAGNHATESLYPNIAHIPEFDLVAVCDRVEGKARSAARRFGAPTFFTDVGTMVERVAPEAICVCGPPDMHCEVGLQGLRRGIPVFMEKPPALTLAQTGELAEAARAGGAWAMVGFMKRFAPANLVAREYTRSEEFGKLSSISLIHGCGPYDDVRRMLLFNGIHMLDLARFFAGEVTEVSAYGSQQGARIQAVCAVMKFEGGAVGQLNMNSGHTWTDCFEQVYLSGAGAGIVVDASRAVEAMSGGAQFARAEGVQLYGWSRRYYVSGNMAGWAAGGHYTRGYWGELSHFARAVIGQVEPSPTLEDGLAAMRLIDCILESAESSRPVRP